MTQFWEEYLADSESKIDLPKLPSASDFPEQQIDYELNTRLSAEEFENAILASFALLLSRYSGNNDLVIGYPPLVIRILVDQTLTFQQLVAQVEQESQRIQGKEPPSGIFPHISFQEKGSDLSLFCRMKEERLFLTLLCRKGLFSREYLERMAKNLEQLLKECIRRPTSAMNVLQGVAVDELEEIFSLGKGKRLPYPNHLAAHRLFEECALKYADLPALFYEGKTLTYAELNAEANRCARHLQKLGVKKAEFVGLAIDRSMDHIIALLAILKADATPVPIDASYPLERKLFMLKDTQAQLLVTQDSYRILFSIEGLKIFCLDKERTELKKYSSENLEGSANPLDLININYTSGSTGLAKGVQVTHRGVVRLVVNSDWIRLTPQDHLLHMANVSFDAASFEIWGALLNGACLYIYPHKEFSAEELALFLEKERITHALFTARLFNLLIEFKLTSLKSLRFLASAGDVMSAYHAKVALQALPHCAIVNAYGPTENGVATTAFTARDLTDISETIPIGKPIANTEVYILDSARNPVPIGVTGEIYCGGDGVAKGYLNRPDLTEERFISNPFGEGNLYRSGDLGCFWPNGYIDFLGRRDTQVKIRGFRVEIGEIEECLRKHPKVGDCVVIARKDQQGDSKLAAYAEPRGEEPLNAEELRSFLESKLIPIMVPAFVLVLPKLPVTPNGKVDRKALPAPEEATQQMKAFQAPKTPIEEIIADIWATLLEIPRVGRTDSFLALGGHSITAAQMAIMVDQAFNIHVPMGLIFEEKTLEKYAKRVGEIMEKEAVKKGRPITTQELFWIWRARESRLDQTISADKELSASQSQYQEPQEILLTGATGFVGAFMLRELLEETKASKIHCLARASSSEEAAKRIESSLKKYGLWSSEMSRRIFPLAADLEQPRFGLSEKAFEQLANTLDCIYHVGAYVNHSLPYSALKAANVKGTEEALRLACQGRCKPFHFISTVAVFEAGNDQPVSEESDLGNSKYLTNGYAESKWVAEKLVMIARSRNVLASIYRLGRVSGHSVTGQGNGDDFLWRMAEASIYLQRVPDIELKENITPVDYVCRAIRTIASDPQAINKNYHIVNPELFSYKEVFSIFQKLGYSLEFVPYEKWRRSLVEAAVTTGGKRLQAIAPLFSEVDLTHSGKALILGHENADRVLQPKGVICPRVDEKMIKIYIDAFAAKGFFPQPERVRQ